MERKMHFSVLHDIRKILILKLNTTKIISSTFYGRVLPWKLNPEIKFQLTQSPERVFYSHDGVSPLISKIKSKNAISGIV